LTTKVPLIGVVIVLAALAGAGLYANHELARHSPVAPTCPVPVVVPEPQPLPPVEIVVVEKPVVVKPIIYVDKSRCSFGWNKAALKLLQTTHVIHIQYNRGYDVIDMRNDRVDMQMGEWPTNWYDGPITIGIYNPDTGQYAVSVRVE